MKVWIDGELVGETSGEVMLDFDQHKPLQPFRFPLKLGPIKLKARNSNRRALMKLLNCAESNRSRSARDRVLRFCRRMR